MIRQPFSERLKLLRTAHGLKSAHLADFLHINTAASISQLESGLVLPKLPTLIQVASFFGVTTDWLLGAADYPYSIETMSRIENSLLLLSSPGIVLSDSQLFIKSVWFLHNPAAKDYLFSRDKYSLPVRANILFCLNILLRLSEQEKVEKKYIKIFSQSQKICEDYILKKENITTPVFNILPESTVGGAPIPNPLDDYFKHFQQLNV